MMKANELRIGNLVAYGNQITKVCELHYSELTSSLSPHGIKYSDIVPIPLTEEWLWRFKYESEFFIKKFRFDLLGSDFRLRLYYQGTNDIILHHIKYVHQLQNLYFALTGEELSLNPKLV